MIITDSNEPRNFEISVAPAPENTQQDIPIESSMTSKPAI